MCFLLISPLFLTRLTSLHGVGHRVKLSITHPNNELGTIIAKETVVGRALRPGTEKFVYASKLPDNNKYGCKDFSGERVKDALFLYAGGGCSYEQRVKMAESMGAQVVYLISEDESTSIPGLTVDATSTFPLYYQSACL